MRHPPKCWTFNTDLKNSKVRTRNGSNDSIIYIPSLRNPITPQSTYFHLRPNDITQSSIAAFENTVPQNIINAAGTNPDPNFNTPTILNILAIINNVLPNGSIKIPINFGFVNIIFDTYSSNPIDDVFALFQQDLNTGNVNTIILTTTSTPTQNNNTYTSYFASLMNIQNSLFWFTVTNNTLQSPLSNFSVQFSFTFLFYIGLQEIININ